MPKFTLFITLLLGSPLLYADTLPADPTRPLATFFATDKQVAPDQGYILSALITGKSNPSAVINGQRVQVGDRVDGAEVMNISKQGVTLNTGTEFQTVSLAERAGFSKVKRGK